ncbi:hypothetical protein RIVM261_043250 [Rivularia sp. IAM M-261]|nr:hypothetical protein CAL7716_083590 [Calothrix sp. PCC 7716]GJD19369.1 hypothetical protein RIVM261_043250 [Rivularia sp. IAM M-261]
MTTTVQAKEVTLLELETNYGLQIVYDEQFFPEWQDNLPQITDAEKQRLDHKRRQFSFYQISQATDTSIWIFSFVLFIQSRQ